MTLLAIEGLHAGYGRIPILQGIDMSVARGSFTGVLGHNGMGKTTLMRTIMGQITPTAGRIMLDGQDITRLSTHGRAARGLAYVPQGREIFSNLTVEENLQMGLLGLPSRAEQKTEMARILEDLPRLKPILTRSGGVLSGGEQQILAIARSLCTDPTLLILDEPTEGIQPSIVEEIIDILHALRKSRDLTVLLVEQKLDFIEALADTTFVIQRGTITGTLSPKEMSDPDTVREFVGLS